MASFFARDCICHDPFWGPFPLLYIREKEAADDKKFIAPKRGIGEKFHLQKIVVAAGIFIVKVVFCLISPTLKWVILNILWHA